MCGICGWAAPKTGLDSAAAARVVAQMSAAIAHRGPDDEGVYFEPDHGVAFGFRRLAIRDLSKAGHQPMTSHSGRHVIVFNGEIYNCAELAKMLAGRVDRFRGHSDTEVFLELLEAFGVEKALSQTVGMFAFALFDKQAKKLYLARDRFGEKPLYYFSQDGALVFASELKALMRHPDANRSLDREAAANFLRFGWVPSPKTIFAGVEQLLPGHYLCMSADGELRTTPYWSAVDAAQKALGNRLSGSEDDIIQEGERTIADAVERRLASDVPLGAFLSGGIDSSLIVALMQRSASRPVATFSIGFSVNAFDEAAHAEAVAKHLGTAHHTFYVSPAETLAVIPELPEIWDEPFADPSALPMLLLARLARRHVTVVMSGDGGDELFAGYSRYRLFERFLGLDRVLPRGLGAWGRGGERLLASNVFGSAMHRAIGSRRAPIQRWLTRAGHIEDRSDFEGGYRSLLQLGAEPGHLGVPEPSPSGLWSGSLKHHFPGVVPRCQMLDTLTYLPDDILVKVDRATMAASLEARTPLLDPAVFELAWRLPQQLKSRSGYQKWLLRQILYRHVPREIVDRPKMGFNVPIGEWLRGPLRPWAESLLAPQRLRESELYDPTPVRALWDRHLAGENWQGPLWCILMLESWRRRWL